MRKHEIIFPEHRSHRTFGPLYKALGFTSLVLFVLVASYTFVLDRAQKKSFALIAEFEKSTGSNIRFLAYRYSLSGIHFEDLEVRGPINIRLKRLSTKLGIQWSPKPSLAIKEIIFAEGSVAAQIEDLKILAAWINQRKQLIGNRGKSRQEKDLTITGRNLDLKILNKQSAEVASFKDNAFEFRIGTKNLSVHSPDINLLGNRFLGENHFQLRQNPHSHAYSVKATLAARDHEPWSLEADIASDLKNLKINAQLNNWPAQLSKSFGSFFPQDQKLDLNIEATLLAESNQRLNFLFHLNAKDMTIAYPSLSLKALNLHARTKFRGHIDLATQTAAIDSGFVVSQDSPAKLWFTAQRERSQEAKDSDPSTLNTENSFVTSLQFKLKESSCQDVLNSLPEGLIPELKGFGMEGKISFDHSIRLDERRPEQFEWQVASQNMGCINKIFPERFSKGYLSKSFRFKNKYRKESEVVVGSGTQENSGFSPLSIIPSYLAGAVIQSEDAQFFHHRGFEWQQVLSAMRKNISTQSMTLGASTLSMQLVKNLFLSREKTFSRKIQEWFLTWHLEQQLPKDRILEIYLNIVEFGPEIYGITHASRHFFNKAVSQLTPSEASFLAKNLPAPTERYKIYCQGHLDSQDREKMGRDLKQLSEAGYISESMLREELKRPLVFNRQSSFSQESCHNHIASYRGPRRSY